MGFKSYTTKSFNERWGNPSYDQSVLLNHARTDDEYALLKAIRKDNLLEASEFIDSGVNINIKTCDENLDCFVGTSLTYAFENGSLPMVKLLINNGAIFYDMSLENSLYMLVIDDNVAVIKWLIESGYDLNYTTWFTRENDFPESSFFRNCDRKGLY